MTNRPHFANLRDENAHTVDLKANGFRYGDIPEFWAIEHEKRTAASESRKPFRFVHIVYAEQPYAVFDKGDTEASPP